MVDTGLIWRETAMKEVVDKAQTFNHRIKTIEDLFEHMKRLQECTNCQKEYYDKPCPTCRKKEIDFHVNEALDEVIIEIDKWLAGMPSDASQPNVDDIIDLKSRLEKLRGEK